MSKLETVPFKTPLDPRTNLNFDTNRVPNIIFPDYEQTISYHRTSTNNTNFLLF